MAIKKSQLYSALWDACNALRGGMDASQYKDYVLVVLFLKYISDKAKSPEGSDIEVPDGCSFYDVAECVNKDAINEKMNTSLEAIAKANELEGVINNVDFADENKLGKGKDMIDTVSKLIKVFQDDNLNFANNRAADDDLIGDAYEYLMRQFASQSGKSKGQFYTPAEVSRVMANIIGINKDTRQGNISIYDPTCGSGSLLLRAKAEAHNDNISIDGQEKDLATIGMARMSMIIHGVEDANLMHGDTLNNPLNILRDDTTLRQFDYIVANPPFSTKGWMKTAQPQDRYGRWGSDNGQAPVPPQNCGDYAFLLHIIASLKPNGKAACILPHGVLFRGNDEALIREWLIRHHLIRGIIGLPSNLFYGTGIPACIIIIDKADTLNRQGIFMINAKDGYAKDGNKNRLREMDIRRIEDVWEAQQDVPHYARFVPYEEILSPKNNGNLNIPRYVTPADTEVQQDIYAHIHGGIPAHDVEETLASHWEACPSLQPALFRHGDNGYYALTMQDPADIRRNIDTNTDYLRHADLYRQAIDAFFSETVPEMKQLDLHFDPKQKIEQWGNLLLEKAQAQQLVNPYEVYEILRNYWAETMQDDCYLIARDGWHVSVSTERRNPTYRDLLCDLVPVEVLVREYFQQQDEAICQQEAEIETLNSQMAQLVEEHPDVFDDTIAELRIRLELMQQPEQPNEQAVLLEMQTLFDQGKDAKEERDALVRHHPEIFQPFDKVTKATVKRRLKLLPSYVELDKDTIELYGRYLELDDQLTQKKNELKDSLKEMLVAVQDKYATLKESDVQHLVVDCKWHATIHARTIDLFDEVSRQMTNDILTLQERYSHTLTDLDHELNDLRRKVNATLADMGINL